MSHVTRRHLGGLALSAGLVAARGASAQAWPTRPVTVVVPWPAGGSTDSLARAIGRHLGDKLGQPFVVDNRSGANGNIGTAAVARSAPDGYTLVVTTNGPITNNTLLYRQMPFDPFKDLAPVALLAELPIVLAARSQAPYKTVQELIAYAKANPDRVNCGTPPLGSAAHLAVELLQHRAGEQVVGQRRGAAIGHQVQADAGAVDMGIDLVTTYLPHIQAGTLRALGVTSAEPIPQLPDTPTVQAQGIPDYRATGWISLLGPAGLPAEIVQRLNTESNDFLRLDQSRTMLAQLGLTPLGGSPADLSRRMTAEVDLWRPIIQSTGISID